MNFFKRKTGLYTWRVYVQNYLTELIFTTDNELVDDYKFSHSPEGHLRYSGVSSDLLLSKSEFDRLLYNWSLIKITLLALAVSNVRTEDESLAFLVLLWQFHKRHPNRRMDMEYFVNSIPKSMDYLFDGTTPKGLKLRENQRQKSNIARITNFKRLTNKYMHHSSYEGIIGKDEQTRLIAQMSNFEGVEKSIKKGTVFQKLVYDSMNHSDNELPDKIVILMVEDLERFYSFHSKNFRRF